MTITREWIQEQHRLATTTRLHERVSALLTYHETHAEQGGMVGAIHELCAATAGDLDASRESVPAMASALLRVIEACEKIQRENTNLREIWTDPRQEGQYAAAGRILAAMRMEDG